VQTLGVGKPGPHHALWEGKRVSGELGCCLLVLVRFVDLFLTLSPLLLETMQPPMVEPKKEWLVNVLDFCSLSLPLSSSSPFSSSSLFLPSLHPYLDPGGRRQSPKVRGA